jgi:hypothetical protein
VIKIINLLNDRTLSLGQQIETYRNLNKGELFSIKDKKTGLVVAHADRYRVENVTCKVREGGRQRAINEGRRNVHAFLTCIYSGECEMDIAQMSELYYNPFTLDSFINKDTGEKVEYVDLAYFQDGKCYINK